MNTEISVVAVAFILWFSMELCAGPLMIHQKADTMAANPQGPFVMLPSGEVLTVRGDSVWRSNDKGKTWTLKKILDNTKYVASPEGGIVRTPKGEIVYAFSNGKEISYGKNGKGKWGTGDIKDWVLPTYVIRSEDDGNTWSEPHKIQTSWCGAVRQMIRLKSGRLLLVGQSVVPWSHTTLTYASDDAGKTWKASNELTIGELNSHDHDGAMEATIVERKDGTVYMLIRTTKGVQYESVSTDEGNHWSEPAPTTIASSHCCALMNRLKDGRILMLWNAAPVGKDIFGSREELSVAFSDDDAKTWSKPVVVAARYVKQGDPWPLNQVSYPQFFEIEPGVYWMSSGYGTLRMRVADKNIRDTLAAPEGVKPCPHLKLADQQEKVYK